MGRNATRPGRTIHIPLLFREFRRRFYDSAGGCLPKQQMETAEIQRFLQPLSESNHLWNAKATYRMQFGATNRTIVPRRKYIYGIYATDWLCKPDSLIRINIACINREKVKNWSAYPSSNCLNTTQTLILALLHAVYHRHPLPLSVTAAIRSSDCRLRA